MKKLTITIITLLIALTGYSQKVIENPKFGFSTVDYLTLKKIEVNDTSTVLHFYIETDAEWVSIPKKTYIQPAGDTTKLFIKATEGVPLGKKFSPENGKADYKLFFPKINASLNKFDYGEANDGGNWFIYDILLKQQEIKSYIPDLLSGNWFATTTGNWEVSFFDTSAIYKNQVWAYGKVNLQSGAGSIELKSNAATISLTVKPGKKGSYWIGETDGNIHEYSNKAPETVTQVDTKPYELPVFKYDSATLSGYIKGYSERMGFKTGTIYINDLLSGEQNSHLIKISPEGFFSVKLPIYYPHETYLRGAGFSKSVYLEPGKDIFLLIASVKQREPLLIMGENSRMYFELAKLDNEIPARYSEVSANILEQTLTEYKNHCLKLKQLDLNKLDQLNKKYKLSAKAYQIKKFSIEYQYAYFIMEYAWNYETAYRKKNNIPREQRELNLKVESPKAEYYDFLTNELANNPLAVICREYDSFINRLMFLDIIRNNTTIRYSTLDIANALEKSGYSFTAEEKDYIEALRQKELSDYGLAEKQFQAKIQTQQMEFFKKYGKALKDFYKTTKDGMNIMNIEQYLLDNGTIFTEDDKAYIQKTKDYQTTEAYKKNIEFYSKYGSVANKFGKNHSDFFSKALAQKRKIVRLENLRDILGIQPGFATDIMASQDECRKIVAEFTPVSDSTIFAIKKQIKTPFIADYLERCNSDTKRKIESNKSNGSYVVNEVPKTEADKVFDEIMKKYRGKVVYVDFWATWCGPCRSGIERIKPLKEELAGENVVFVYITGPSSPKGTWDNMIPNIKGEHYRVSEDEWNYLGDKFKITGIPHYALVDKNGTVVNPAIKFMSNESLKDLLMKTAQQ